MNIGFVATRLAGVDGVSLETAKIAALLEQMGHRCFYCAGELDPQGPPGRLVPLMHFKAPTIQALHDESFGTPHAPPGLHRRIYDAADAIRAELEAFVRTFSIDLIFPQNACAIPMNIPLGLAIRDLVERTRIPT